MFIMQERKIIRDSLHGDIIIDGIFLELMESPEIQRLSHIKQLGFAHLVFPGAHHTRLEHSLGTYKVAQQASTALSLATHERDLLCCAALLHDIGHGPFSHTLESLLRTKLNVDHVDLTEQLLCGSYDILDEHELPFVSSERVVDILHHHGLHPEEIAEIIRGTSQHQFHLSQLLNSPIDVDQLDYLLRDAYYTGVAYGAIDMERFLQTLVIFNGQLAVQRKGVGVVENIFMARALMYSSVYFHKTVRIAELMLSKAIELMPDVQPFRVFKMTDGELLNSMSHGEPFQREIAIRLKYRRLYKQAFTVSPQINTGSYKDIIKQMEDPEVRREKEREIEEHLGLSPGHLIIDVPFQELHHAEPRLDQTDIVIEDKGDLVSLDTLTPVAQAIKSRVIPDWTLMVLTDEHHRKQVYEKVERLLFN
jgi:HD superfamily phosphohydrolase